MSYRAEILSHWRATDELTRAAGLGWYREAARESRAIARLAPNGVGPVRMAAVIAALSPRTQWSVNLRWSRAMADAASYSGVCPAVHTTMQRELAWSLMSCATPLAAIDDMSARGVSDKVRAFFRNLSGDLSAVTVDVWAARACGLSPDDATRELNRVGGYARIADAYRAVAELVDVQPAELQAAVWLQVRGVKPTDPEGFRT